MRNYILMIILNYYNWISPAEDIDEEIAQHDIIIILNDTLICFQVFWWQAKK